MKTLKNYAPSKIPVFYNPFMKLNRDIAVLVLQAYQRIMKRNLVVSEPLAGCGVRGIRFAKEVSGISEVNLNDINPEAFKLIKRNIEINGVEDTVFLTNKDANLFLSQHDAPHKRFDYIDIDPFGTPVHFLDSAIRALKNKGVLALTATDLAPLCGVYPTAALRKYGGFSLRTEYSQEIALRLLAGCIAFAAAKHDIGVNIIFSHKNNHYVRVYVQINQGAKKANQSLKNIGFIYHCFKCLNRKAVFLTQSPDVAECDVCGSTLRFAGPLWLGKIADKDFCELIEIEACQKRTGDENRIRKIVRLIRDESDAPPTYFVVDYICDKLGIPIPPLTKVISQLRQNNYKIWFTHFHNRGFRTDATARTVMEMVRKALH
ncbi:tRNA (guanine(10)-N(2))-dimethyltransferase [Candidatus Bathyarchaeota archaeon]|nr:tRNA (guanine(10)-N(2))-dimethyltransferase [Candidatus Bathyarchaeota archaeon]